MSRLQRWWHAAESALAAAQGATRPWARRVTDGGLVLVAVAAFVVAAFRQNANEMVASLIAAEGAVAQALPLGVIRAVGLGVLAAVTLVLLLFQADLNADPVVIGLGIASFVVMAIGTALQMRR